MATKNTSSDEEAQLHQKESHIYLVHPHHHPLYHHDHHPHPGADQPRRGSWRPRPGKDEEVQRLPQGKNHHRPHPHNHIFLTFNPGQICSRVLISVNLLLLLPLSPGFARSCYINFSTFSGPWTAQVILLFQKWNWNVQKVCGVGVIWGVISPSGVAVTSEIGLGKYLKGHVPGFIFPQSNSCKEIPIFDTKRL